MMKRWWCMDCRNTVELDKHGRCGNCESEAVDFTVPKDELTGSFSTIAVEYVGAQVGA